MPVYNRIPLIGKFLKSEAITKELTPTQISNLGQTYRNIIGFGNNTSFATTAFKKLDAQRTADNDTVPLKSKGSDGLSIQDKINDTSTEEATEASNAAKEIKRLIETALQPNDNYTKALNKFNDNTETFTDLVKKIPNGGFGAQDVLSTMKYYIDKSRTAIKEQQKLDEDHLSEQFNTDGFKTALINTFKLNPDPENAETKNAIDALKQNMIKDLKDTHGKQLADFDKTTSEALNKLHQASAEEYKQMGFLEILNRDAANRKMLDDIAQMNMNKSGTSPSPPTAFENANSPEAKDRQMVKLSNVQISDIKKFKTMTGMEVTQKSPGTFQITFPMISPRYYQSSEQRQVADTLLIAQAIKAQGNDTINWTMDGFKDRDTMIERAKQAYEGSVRAGFDLDKITVTDPSGKQLKLEELYQDDPKTLGSLRQRAAQVKQEIASQTIPALPEGNKIRSVKDYIKERRQHYIDHPEDKPKEPVASPPEEDEDKAATATTGPTT